MGLDEPQSPPRGHVSISYVGCLLLPRPTSVSETASMARKVIVLGKGDFQVSKKSQQFNTMKCFSCILHLPNLGDFYLLTKS